MEGGGAASGEGGGPRNRRRRRGGRGAGAPPAGGADGAAGASGGDGGGDGAGRGGPAADGAGGKRNRRKRGGRGKDQQAQDGGGHDEGASTSGSAPGAGASNENKPAARANGAGKGSKGRVRRGKSCAEDGRSARAREEASEASEALTGERLKLVIRKLPPNLTEEDCAAVLRAAFPDEGESSPAGEEEEPGRGQGDDGAESSSSALEKAASAPCVHERVAWFSYRRGKAGAHRVVPSRAYVAVTSTADVAAIHKAMDGRLFVGDRGTQYRSTVEYAPSQRIPRPLWRTTSTIEDDPEYQQFISELRAREGGDAPNRGPGGAASDGAVDGGAPPDAAPDAEAAAAAARPTPLVEFLLAKQRREAEAAKLKKKGAKKAPGKGAAPQPAGAKKRGKKDGAARSKGDARAGDDRQRGGGGGGAEGEGQHADKDKAKRKSSRREKDRQKRQDGDAGGKRKGERKQGDTAIVGGLIVNSQAPVIVQRKANSGTDGAGGKNGQKRRGNKQANSSYSGEADTMVATPIIMRRQDNHRGPGA